VVVIRKFFPVNDITSSRTVEIKKDKKILNTKIKQTPFFKRLLNKIPIKNPINGEKSIISIIII
jgi:hypothetical protein